MSNLANIVESIVSAFHNSLQVLQKVRRRQRPIRAKGGPDHDKGELRLRNSIRRGPTDITREYERNVRELGDRFATGDGGSA